MTYIPHIGRQRKVCECDVRQNKVVKIWFLTVTYVICDSIFGLGALYWVDDVGEVLYRKKEKEIYLLLKCYYTFNLTRTLGREFIQLYAVFVRIDQE
jgi:hypothetical protein